jgi:hypothetical protein
MSVSVAQRSSRAASEPKGKGFYGEGWKVLGPGGGPTSPHPTQHPQEQTSPFHVQALLPQLL